MHTSDLCVLTAKKIFSPHPPLQCWRGGERGISITSIQIWFYSPSSKNYWPVGPTSETWSLRVSFTYTYWTASTTICWECIHFYLRFFFFVRSPIAPNDFFIHILDRLRYHFKNAYVFNLETHPFHHPMYRATSKSTWDCKMTRSIKARTEHIRSTYGARMEHVRSMLEKHHKNWFFAFLET